MEHVEHDGRSTAYHQIDRGEEGPGLLCVHGSGGVRQVWRSQLSRPSRDRPVAALDLTGHGASDDLSVDPGLPALDVYADDVIAVADSTDSSILCGNSLGGAVVMHVALERDFDPEGLLLVGTGARLSVRSDLLAWLQNDFDRAIEFLHESGRLFFDPDERDLESSKETMRTVGARVTARDFQTCDAFDVRDRIDGIDSPTLAITGEHDELTPPWYHAYLAGCITNAEWTTVEQAAHLSMLERPTAFNAAVVPYLASI